MVNPCFCGCLSILVGPVIAFLIVFLIMSVCTYYLGLTLKRDAKQEDLSKCRKWFITAAISHVIGLFILIGMIIVIIFVCKNGFTMQIVGILIVLLAMVGLLVYKTFLLWSIYESVNKCIELWTMISLFAYSPTAVYNAGGRGL